MKTRELLHLYSVVWGGEVGTMVLIYFIGFCCCFIRLLSACLEFTLREEFCYHLEFCFILGLIYYGTKNQEFCLFVFILLSVYQQKERLRCIAIHIHQASGICLLLGGCSAHLGQGDLEDKLERIEIAYEHQICYVFDTTFILLFQSIYFYIYYSEFLILAIWTKKTIKYEYMMDLRENHFGEFFNCIFLSWKTQNICVSFKDLTDRYIYLS